MSDSIYQLGRLADRDLLLHRIVFEVRYADGSLYYDRCGRVIRRFKKSTKWISERAVAIDRAVLRSMESGLQFTFGVDKLDSTLEQQQGGPELTPDVVDAFVAETADACELVQDELALEQLTRVGVRAWYFVPAGSTKEAETWMSSLGLFSLNPNLATAFGGDFEGSSATAVIKGEDCHYRIALASGERTHQHSHWLSMIVNDPKALHSDQRKLYREKARIEHLKTHNPEFVAILDIDAYVEDPVECDARYYIQKHVGEFITKLRASIQSR